MTLKTILAAKGGGVVSIEPTADLLAAAKLLNTHRIGVLVVNLGTPRAPRYGAVWRFLRQFLGDRDSRPWVIEFGPLRTPAGAVTQQIIASVIRTCWQQRVDPGALIERLLQSPVPGVAPLPSLVSGP